MTTCLICGDNETDMNICVDCQNNASELLEQCAPIIAAHPQLLKACEALLACPEMNLAEMDHASVDAVALGLAAVKEARSLPLSK